MANEKEIHDWISSFPQGMDSGVDPLQLPKKQLAFAHNATLRGDFLRGRPAFINQTLSYATALVQTGFQSGWYQGAGYYRPDYSAETIAIAVAGRVFLATPDSENGIFITEITIPGDPNPPNQSQVWFKQAELFLLMNDGKTLPFIYDGAVSRRSRGPSQQVGVAVGGELISATGQSFPIQLNAPYTGPLNEAIFIDQAIYVVTNIGGVASTFNVTLKNLSDTSVNVAAGESLIVEPANLGYVISVVQNGTHQGTINGLPYNFPVFDVTITAPLPVASISHVTIEGNSNWNVQSKSGSVISIWTTGPISAVNPGDLVVWTGNNQPNVTAGILGPGFVVPGIGATVAATLSSAYIGSLNQVLFIGTGQYQVVGFGTTSPPIGTIITVENLTDTPGFQIAPGAILATLPELPAGRMMAYNMCRINECLTDGISFIIGDIVGGSSGSPKYDFRDSILKITENESLLSGVFRVPGSDSDIKAMQGVAMLDASLGQGPLQVFTAKTVFSCNLPVNRADWQKLTTPILPPSLIGSGACSQDSVSQASGDLIFASSDGEIRSLLLARLDFNKWGNTPMSQEMLRVLMNENRSLLAYRTSTVFDNRYLLGAGLTQANRGVYSSSIIALNFDPNSTLLDKQASIYDGQWEGLNVLTLVSGTFGGLERCFAVCLSQDLTKIEIHEIKATFEGDLDDGITPIDFYGESSVLFNQSESKDRQYLRLVYGEIYVTELLRDTHFKVYYKPDQWPDWVLWHQWTEKFDPATDPGFRPRIPLPEPDINPCDVTNNRPLREGYGFQVKIEMDGGVLMGGKFTAIAIPEPKRGEPTCT